MAASPNRVESKPPRRFLRRLATAAKIAGILVLLVLIAGATYEWAASTRDARLYPPPGQFFRVGDHNLHIYCTGEGSPTVILDAGLGDSVASWDLVQPEISKFTRVCSYDRAGLGWSEFTSGPRTSEVIIAEEAQLLTAAGVQPPYIVVGHSFGGMNQRLFAFRHRDQVVGIVFVDSSHPDQLNRFPKSLAIESYLGHMDIGVLTTPLGVPRLLHWCRDDYTFAAAPHEWDRFQPIASALECREANWRASRAEEISFRESGREVAAATTLGNIPLVVLSHDPAKGAGFPPDIAVQAESLWNEMQEELRALSNNGKRIIAKGSGHYVEVYRPELVIGAIRDVVNSAHTGASIAAATTTQ
jgi:pimeloyl-ACP methyl ester carboxylesterase